MSGNGLFNAGFLDGATDWSAAGSGASIAVDEATLGGPGRAVLKATGSGTSTNSYGARNAASGRVACAAGNVLEAFVGYWASIGVVSAKVEWYSSAPALLSSTALTVVRAPPAATPARGLKDAFGYANGFVTAPASTASAGITVQTLLAGSVSYTVAMLKPFLSVVAAAGTPQVFDPGSHTNVDLQLDRWPLTQVRFLADSTRDPVQNRVAFTGDARIPNTRKVSPGGWSEFRGRVRLSQADLDTLEAFHESVDNAEGFWLTDPFQDQLCVAKFLEDGAPKVSELKGLWRMTDVGLLLNVG